jgi:hypothetical protein
MAGFKADGGVSFSDGGVTDVVFLLKSSEGKDLKTYKVPSDKADAFVAGIQAEEPSLRESLGEMGPLRLIRVSRCF